ncbi:olfactory receptor 4B13-like [Nelusetta ayraudi]|uniref:olfactory receptor 4B13-like n=1 Tax=Nelusetta ayraudi TaxID=303726 RepID=UPI003F730678
MPLNSSSVFSYFVLAAYLPAGNLRYLCFAATALLYGAIVLLNSSIIAVICLRRSLHRPVYLFLCSLFANELYGSTALFPFLLLQLLQELHTVTPPLCFLQIFCLYTYAQVEFCNLALMSYDRYLAICCPLLYNSHMSPSKALVFIAAVWCYSFLKFVVTLSLNVRLRLCSNVIDSLYCHNYLIAKLACTDATVNNVYGLVGTVLTVLVPLAPTVVSYLRILRVCRSASPGARRKAVGTCAPQLVSLLNFSFGCCFEILQSRFDRAALPAGLRVALSLYFLLIPPLLNPLMYGLQMSHIRWSCKEVLLRRVGTK